jgi:hypothetical protein
VLLESQLTNGVPANFVPHLWYSLDNLKKVTPAGWTFSNPRANSILTASVQSRWSLLVGPGNVPAVGTILTKRHAPYWEVRLAEVSDEQLASYDVLVVAAYGASQLNPLERERLRKFADQGGTLWVDFQGSPVDAVNSFPWPFVGLGTGGNFDADFQHPLLSRPYSISYANIASMEQGGYTGIGPASVGNQLATILSNVQGDSNRLLPIVANSSTTIVALGKIGDGNLLVTSFGGVANLINRAVQGTTYNVNRGFTALNSGSDLSKDNAAKLIVNAISLRADSAQTGGGSRRSNASSLDLGAPLLKRFEGTDATTGPHMSSHAVLFKGALFFTGVSGASAFDTQPGRDLDGDGRPDDGLPDLRLGQNRDALWEFAATGGISAPVAAEVSNTAASIPRDQLLFTRTDGSIVALAAFPKTDGVLQPATTVAYTVTPPGGASTSSGEPIAPTLHDGIGFGVDNVDSGGRRVGRVWLFDPRTGQRLAHVSGNDWIVGGAGQDFLGEVSGPPTIGYIPIQDNSGGVDRVVYLPTAPIAGLGAGPNGTAGVTSVWMGVRGEKPPVTQIDASTGDLILTTRASLQGLPIYVGNANDPMGIKLTVLRANGVPLTEGEMQALFTGAVTQTGGLLTFGMQTGQVLPTNATVRLDYNIDWGTNQPSLTGQIIRGQLFFPDDNDRNRRVLGTMALSAKGTLHILTGTAPNLTPFPPVAPPDSVQGDAYYAVREEGRGTFKLLNRFTLHGAYQMTLNQANPASVPTLFTDNDGVLSFAPIDGTFTHYAFQGSPALRGDKVFVSATGRKTGAGFPPRGVIPFTLLMAFQADPLQVEIKTPDLGDGFSMLQPDITRSQNKATPDQYSVLQPGQFNYEKRQGAAFGVIRLDSLMSSNRGPVQNAFSTSQPIIIRRPTQPDLVIDPGSDGSTFSPLLWYTVIHGVGTSTPPVVAGDEVYVGGASAFPSILSGQFPPSNQGVLNGFSTRIAPNDPFLIPDPVRPWQRQLYRIRTTSGFAANPNVIWPQAGGVTNFDDFRVRLLQTALPQTTGIVGLAAGDGTVAAYGEEGLVAFTRADFLVADEGRLARFDSSGNPIWSSDLSLNAGTDQDVNSTSSVQRMVRPTRAYRLAENDFIVADPGANRVIRISQNGRELRSLTRFLNPSPGFEPSGWQANSPTTLKEPRDVAAYTSYQRNSTLVAGAQPLEFWRHYLVADTGNRRLIELIDRYVADPNTGDVGDVITVAGVRQLGVPLWVSPGEFSGGRFDYHSINRMEAEQGGNSYPFYVAGIGSTMPSRADTGLDSPGTGTVRLTQDGNGGIVIIDPNNPANNQVISQVQLPAFAQNIFWDDASNAFANAATPARILKLGNLNSVTARYIDGQLAIMFTSAAGVFEIVQSGSDWVVRWMVNREAYRVMRGIIAPRTGAFTGTPTSSNPRDFRPTFAKRLDSGEVLIVNGYTGDTRGDFNVGNGSFSNRRVFDGEVVQLNGDVDPTNDNSVAGFGFGKTNLGFGSIAIRFELPPISGARGILLPVFADRN